MSVCLLVCRDLIGGEGRMEWREHERRPQVRRLSMPPIDLPAACSTVAPAAVFRVLAIPCGLPPQLNLGTPKDKPTWQSSSVDYVESERADLGVRQQVANFRDLV